MRNIFDISHRPQYSLQAGEEESKTFFRDLAGETIGITGFALHHGS